MLSTVKDEALFFMADLIFSNATYLAKFRAKLFPFMNDTDFASLDGLYPPTAYPYEAVASAFSDFYFNCPGRRLAQSYSAAGLPVFKALFSTLD
jgi:carboxylesterase type B